ncbi:MAG: Ig-like domain-containing protein, partial [Flavobacteriales bacterium]|nr:Ig-like domain-containing protein [Flavobacteriales bacterium]
MRPAGIAGLNPSVVLLATALLAFGCAQVGDLSGGPRDEAPPRLIAAEPPNGSVHFGADRIVLRFDERITLDRVRDRLLVSPPLDAPPDVRLAGPRNVLIALNAPLRPGTTYSFAIGEAVKDLTEGNIAAGLTYVMSTGSALDSNMVGGLVVDAFDGTPEKDVLVVLYHHEDTATIRT